jgi:hypothetical protein
MRWLIGSILFAGLAAAVGCTVESKDITDDDDSSSSSGSTSSSGNGGSSTSTASSSTTSGGGGYGGGCEGLCEKVGDAMCVNDTQASCLTECEGLYTQSPEACKETLDALVACQLGATVVCDGGDAEIEGCDAEGLAFFDCLSGGGMPGACYANQGECNPLASTCGAGQACDVARDNQFHCFPPPNDVPIGGSCNLSSGPYCQNGGTCLGNVCRAFCCDDTDCTSGTCQVGGNAGSIEIKVCM